MIWSIPSIETNNRKFLYVYSLRIVQDLLLEMKMDVVDVVIGPVLLVVETGITETCFRHTEVPQDVVVTKEVVLHKNQMTTK